MLYPTVVGPGDVVVCPVPCDQKIASSNLPQDTA